MNVEYVHRYLSVDRKGIVRTGVVALGVSGQLIVFKVVELDRTVQGMRTGRKERSED